MHTFFILIMSFIALIWAANHLITGASGIAHRFQLPPLIIGLTVVALATTLPELFFSIIESLKYEENVTIANSIGSNIANIGLVLGITILIKPKIVHHHNLKKTYPILIIAMLFVYSLIIDGYLSRTDGCLFLIGCLVVISILIYLAYSSAPKDPIFLQFKSAMNKNSLHLNITRVIVGLVVLPISAQYIVTHTAQLASWINMDQMTIGLTIQAIGTTLPELSTAIIAALKGEEDLAVGTILGSNIYNLLLVLAFPALINPSKINSIILWRDVPVMLFLAVFLVFLNYNYKKKLSPWHGGILLLVYGCYIISLLLKAHS
jgi:cation:H+ antiporter